MTTHHFHFAVAGMLVLLTAAIASCGKKDEPQPIAEDNQPYVDIRPSSLTLIGNETAQLKATVYDAEGNEMTDAEVTWDSDDESIVSVNESGHVTAKNRPGRAYITALHRRNLCHSHHNR